MTVRGFKPMTPGFGELPLPQCHAPTPHCLGRAFVQEDSGATIQPIPKSKKGKFSLSIKIWQICLENTFLATASNSSIRIYFFPSNRRKYSNLFLEAKFLFLLRTLFNCMSEQKTKKHILTDISRFPEKIDFLIDFEKNSFWSKQVAWKFYPLWIESWWPGGLILRQQLRSFPQNISLSKSYTYKLIFEFEQVGEASAFWMQNIVW